MKSYHLPILILLLICAGVGLAVYKHITLDLPVKPDTKTQVWTIEAQYTFTATDGPVKATMLVPKAPPNYTILNENFISAKNYGVTVSRLEHDNRQAVWALRKASGKQTLYYRADIASDRHKNNENLPEELPTPPKLEEPYASAVKSLLSAVAAKSADYVTFTNEVVKLINRRDNDSASLLLGPKPSDTTIAKTIIMVLNAAKIPARLVHGIYLQEQQTNSATVPWIEVPGSESWKYINPLTGEEGLPKNYFIWWHGDMSLFQVKGADEPEVKFAVTKNAFETLDYAQNRAKVKNNKLMEYSLFSLPVKTQSVYKQLIMVPLGAFVILLLRSFIGIQTFGTFMPVLVALAFRETRLMWGMFLFTLIVALGLSVRFYLERLKLLLVPRLAAVLCIVVALMIVSSIFFHKLDLDTGLSVALFPIVIMAMTIERMSVIWEERSPSDAIRQGIGSLFAAALAYLAMNNPYASHVFYVFPELLLSLMGIVLWVGCYKGYKLTELMRFSALANNKD